MGPKKEFLSNLNDLMAIQDPQSEIERWVYQACDSSQLNQPDLSINLEIVDLINKHLKTYPRDAAFAIVRQINVSSGNASLALVLLDYCAKNCGYPFHIVMSSKEFLNQLVRRFPETARNVTNTQTKILSLIAEWNVVYCQKSRYKDDFKHINDMYRLLEYKGYRFPVIRKDDLNDFAPDVNLKTEEQLEEEDKVNNGLKLEELIRKGTPAALAEANEMMKLMSGYDTTKKRDYKKEVNEELERIESKVILLNDMLNQKTTSDFKKKDATIEDLYSSAKTAQTRLQKFIEDNDDEDRLGRLLEMNDLINIVLKKYSDLKSGKEVDKNAIDRKSDQQSNTTSPNAGGNGLINLLDFDDFAANNQQQGSGPQGSLLNDFNSLNFGNPQVPQMNNQLMGLQQQGFMNPQTMPMNMQQSVAPNPFDDGPQDPFADFGLTNSIKPQNQPINMIAQQQAMNNVQKQGMNQMPFSSPLTAASQQRHPQQTSAPLAQQHTMKPMYQTTNQQQPVMQPKQSPVSTQGSTDPFDLLSGSNSFVPKQNTSPISNGGNDLLGMFGNSSPVHNQPPAKQNQVQSNAYSNLPAISKEFLIFDKNGLQIKLKVPSPTTTTQIASQATFMNVTPVPFTNLNFQVSLPKTMNVYLEPISTTTLPPFNQSQASQNIMINNPAKEILRLRFKVSYGINGAIVNEQGEYSAQI
ncbi:VHS domain-containing protein [Globomyces pollinis-pini]|nr:VHS domain-containing protein [Globomyces pollinis-pini]